MGSIPDHGRRMEQGGLTSGALAPLGVDLQSSLRRVGSSCYVSSGFFIRAVKSVLLYRQGLPHTCFLVSFIQSMVETKAQAKYI
jgi:hypothetical protein